MPRDSRSDTVTLSLEENSGELKIANEVVAIIAALAATEVEGVVSLVGNATHEIIAKQGLRSQSRGINVAVDGTEVTVQISLIIKYGYSVPDVSAKVQERVKNAIENMAGLQVRSVDVSIAGVDVA